MAGNGEMDDKFVVLHKCMDRLPCGHYCQNTEINYLSGKMECSPCRKSKDYSYPCGHSIAIYCGAEKPPSDVCSKCEEICHDLTIQFARLLIDAPEQSNTEDDESDIDTDQSDRGVSDLDYDGDESNCDDADELSDLEAELADLDYDGDESNCDSDDADKLSYFDTDLSDLEYDGGNGSNCDSDGADESSNLNTTGLIERNY